MGEIRTNITKVLKDLSEDFDKILNTLMIMQLCLIVCFFFMKFSHLFLVLLFGVPGPVIYILVKEFWDADKLDRVSKMVWYDIVLFLFNTAFYLVYKLTSAVAKTGGSISVFTFGGLIGISVFLIVLMIQKSEGAKAFAESIKTAPFMFKLGFNFMEEQRKVGDVQICENLETGIPVVLPKKDRYLHMLILGPTGSGKTSQVILPMINQDVQNLEAGITVMEPKGDLAEKVYAMCQYYGRPAFYFNPILDSCPYFNPLQGKEEDVIENMTTTLRMLDPDSATYFQNMSEDLIRNALKVLKRTKGNDATMIDLYRLIAGTKESRSMIQALMDIKGDRETVAENIDIVQYFMGEYFNDKLKTFQNCSGVRAQISKIVSNKFLRKVLNPPPGHGSDIDWDSHLKNGGVICITTAQGSLRDLGSFLGYLLILSFQSSVFKRPGNENTRKDHFLYIDEFQKYANPGFADMLTQGRSYRVASHLATQNRALIGMGSGQEGKDFIELVSTNARNVILFPGGNASDAKYYSDEFGEIIQHKVQTGTSQAQFNPLYGFQKIGYANKSIRESDEEVARFSPSDIIFMEFGQILYKIIQNNTLQIPAKGEIHYIDKDFNDLLDEMIPQNHALMLTGHNPNECRDLSNHGELNDDIDINEIMEKAEALSEGKGLSMIEKSELEKIGVDISQEDEFIELGEEDEGIEFELPDKVQISDSPTDIKHDNNNDNVEPIGFDDMEDDMI